MMWNIEMEALRFAADKNEIQTMNNTLTYLLDLTTDYRWYVEPPIAGDSSFFHRKIKPPMIDDIML